MLNSLLVCGLSTRRQLHLFLLPNTSEIVWSVILTDIYWIIPCTHPFPEGFVVKLPSVVLPSSSIRRVSINNIPFFMLIIPVVKLGEVNLWRGENLNSLEPVQAPEVFNNGCLYPNLLVLYDNL